MSVSEKQVLDMSQLLLQAYDLGYMINDSAEVVEYLFWKQQINENKEIQALIVELDNKKELYEECQRFGHFHPDYHAALKDVQKIQQSMDTFEIVQKYKEAEDKVDVLLHEVSTIIAHSISSSIKVPSNNPLPTDEGCSSCGGGSCGGGCG